MKGLIPAKILCALEQRLGHTCSEHFDLVAGTSIGGILACLIGCGKSAPESVRFFTEDGPNIFGRQQFLGSAGVLRPRYGADGINRVLGKHFGGLHLSDCKRPHVIATAYDLEADEDVIFKSWEPTDFLLWQVARATSAAQTYFPALALRDTRYSITRVLWDGGVVANNPAAIAVTSALKLWPGEDLCVLSLGCGATRSQGIAQRMINAGLLQAASRTLSILFETNDAVPDHLINQVLTRYVRIQPEGRGLAMDDASPKGIRLLEEAAYECLEQNLDRLDKYLQFTTSPNSEGPG
jgi:patatin-like phospholipase/acyl hydrolase